MEWRGQNIISTPTMKSKCLIIIVTVVLFGGYYHVSGMLDGSESGGSDSDTGSVSGQAGQRVRKSKTPEVSLVLC